MYNYPLFAPKQTFARIDFLRQGGDWWTEEALRMLNLLLKTIQSSDYIAFTHMDNGTGNTCTFNSSQIIETLKAKATSKCTL